MTLDEFLEKLELELDEAKKKKRVPSKHPGLKKVPAEKRSEVVKRAKKGEDLGEPGKKFAEIAAKAAKRYGSKEAGQRVAAAVMWKKAAKGTL